MILEIWKICYSISVAETISWSCFRWFQKRKARNSACYQIHFIIAKNRIKNNTNGIESYTGISTHNQIIIWWKNRDNTKYLQNGAKEAAKLKCEVRWIIDARWRWRTLHYFWKHITLPQPIFLRNISAKIWPLYRRSLKNDWISLKDSKAIWWNSIRNRVD